MTFPRALLVGLAALTLSGCPESRPPPWAIAKLAKQREEEAAAEKRAVERKKPKPPPPTVASLMSGLQAELTSLQGRRTKLAPTDVAGRKALLTEVKALEARGLALQQRLERERPDGEDPRLDPLLELLETVGDLRYGLVGDTPGK